MTQIARRIAIRTALALDLDEDREIGRGLTIPGLEGLEKLETLRLGVDSNLDAGTVCGRSLEGVLTGVVTARRELVTSWVREFEWFAISALESVRERVEGEITSKSHSSDEIRRGDESMGGRVSIVTTSEVTVVGGDDCESTFINSVK